KNFYIFLIPLFALALLVGCGPKQEETTPAPTPSAEKPVEKTAPTGLEGEILSGEHEVILRTSKGDITVNLNADAAPKTVTNFIALAQAGYFNDLTFHRVIPNFMIQGGDPSGNGTGGESTFGGTFEDEINAKSYGLDKKLLKDMAAGQKLPEGLENATVMDYYVKQGYTYNDKLQSLPMERGAIAMANRGPNTNGSQFFIIQREGGTPWLDGKHTVFGKVTKGMEVVDEITKVERDASDKPLTPVTFTVEVVK
ncbi:MAG: peptidylprolyl isomerase, partial [Candidatus Peribacteraceae bacterium]|nr:peptidylprolyl isomerase [Candidatus Peribacteraceae bacterium]